MSTSNGDSQSRPDAIQRIQTRIVESGVAVAVIAVLSLAFGSLITPRAAGFMFFGLVALSIAATRIGELSVPFALSFVAVMAVLSLVLPESITSLLAPLVGFVANLAGLDLSRIDPAMLALFSVAAILVIWVVHIRFTSAFTNKSGRPLAANPSTVARRVRQRAERLSREWVAVFVVVFAFLFTAAAQVLGGVGEVGGEVAAMAAQAPVLVGALLGDILAFHSLGGTLPFIGRLPLPELTASQWAVAAGFFLVAGWLGKNALED